MLDFMNLMASPRLRGGGRATSLRGGGSGASLRGGADGAARRKNPNPSVQRGAWGEDLAAAFLVARGWSVLDRNVRPCARDRRCEIDLIVQSADRRSVVFVEVKTHTARSERASLLWGVNRRKRNNLLRACTNWILRNKWHGDFRFDVIEVYGTAGGEMPPEIDHIENVRLFPPKWRFW